jgi:tRNA (guanine37-N1)-methyltransferase
VKIDVLSIFPGYLAPLRESLIGKAVERGVIELGVHDLREWTHDVHRTVDDSPYGGGPGMLMRPEPWGAALDTVAPPSGAPPSGASLSGASLSRAQPRLVVPTPAGRPFTQALAHELALEPWLVFACGRYEGIDARVVEYAAERMVVDEVSLGDYVLAGGEVAVLVMVEAIGRLLPGVLGNAASHEQDSFSDGLLEGPAYTRPEVWRDRPVPDVLLSGHHAAIARWRRDSSLRRTAARRPELLSAVTLDKADRKVLLEAGFPVPSQDVAQ